MKCFIIRIISIRLTVLIPNTLPALNHIIAQSITSSAMTQQVRVWLCALQYIWKCSNAFSASDKGFYSYWIIWLGFPDIKQKVMETWNMPGIFYKKCCYVSVIYRKIIIWCPMFLFIGVDQIMTLKTVEWSEKNRCVILNV